jgi:Fe-S-cluster containining protein
VKSVSLKYMTDSIDQAARTNHPCPNLRQDNPCRQCGACCASFRVSFYWAEAAPNLPQPLTEKLNPWMSCMAGTNSDTPRCHALLGKIGEAVSCDIYDQRPSPCREVRPGDEKCGAARARHGMAALSNIPP